MKRSIITYLVLVYSLYVILNTERISVLGKEDGLIEYFTFFSFICASCFFLRAFLFRKNFYFLLFVIVFFIGAGEEISWGQRIFPFDTPEYISKINIQNEFNIHNIEIFNGHDMNNKVKTGLSRFLSINFLFVLFSLFYGVLLPVLVLVNKSIQHFLKIYIKIPLPPLSLGLFFLINLLIVKFIKTNIWLPNKPEMYYYALAEIKESVFAFIFLILGYYFFIKEKEILTDSITE